MDIAGLQKLTLLDYPGSTAATVFTRGCNLRCPWCYNVPLVDVKSAESAEAPGISEDEFFAFLETRHGKLDGVCITGGEPTMQHGLAEFCVRVKKAGFSVKLDTNGTNARVLHLLVDQGLVDYVALDVKNSRERYPETVGRPDDIDFIYDICSCINLLNEASIPFEFRTTVVDEFHTLDDLTSLARWITSENALAYDNEKDAAINELGFHQPPWYLQQFDEHAPSLLGNRPLHAWSAERMREAAATLQAINPNTMVRGI